MDNETNKTKEVVFGMASFAIMFFFFFSFL